MKINLMLALAATFVFAPVVMDSSSLFAQDEAAAEKPAKPKKKLPKKPLYRNKVADAMKVAEANDEPILAFLLMKGNPLSDFLKKKIMNNNVFKKEFAPKNLVVLNIDVELLDPAAKEKKIKTRGLKQPELKFLENHAINEKAHRAKDDKEPKFDDASNFPAVICVDAMGKQLFRMPRYDADGGFNVWLQSVIAQLETVGKTPVISPKLQKILDAPVKEK